MSLFNTKNIPSLLSLKMCSFANLIGPAVPKGSVSYEQMIFILNKSDR